MGASAGVGVGAGWLFLGLFSKKDSYLIFYLILSLVAIHGACVKIPPYQAIAPMAAMATIDGCHNGSH